MSQNPRTLQNCSCNIVLLGCALYVFNHSEPQTSLTPLHRCPLYPQTSVGARLALQTHAQLCERSRTSSHFLATALSVSRPNVSTQFSVHVWQPGFADHLLNRCLGLLYRLNPFMRSWTCYRRFSSPLCSLITYFSCKHTSIRQRCSRVLTSRCDQAMESHSPGIVSLIEERRGG
jgi:hypothetical protein